MGIDRISRENGDLKENTSVKGSDRKMAEKMKEYETQIIALQKKCMETKEELKKRENAFAKELGKKELNSKGSNNDSDESDFRKENSELKKLVKHLENERVGKDGKDDAGKDGSKIKHLMETVARKDRELANAKVETAKFQALMKKDLEKIKKMSLQYSAPGGNDKKTKELQAQVEALQKDNQKYKNKFKIFMMESQKQRGGEAKPGSRQGTPGPEEDPLERMNESSDPKRELRTVRPVKASEENRKRKFDRRMSEESSADKMDVDENKEKGDGKKNKPKEKEEKKNKPKEKEEKIKIKKEKIDINEKEMSKESTENTGADVPAAS